MFCNFHYSFYILKLFESKKVRTHWDDTKKRWYFSIVDIIGILTDQPSNDRARNYWKVLKNRLLKEGNETVINCNQLKASIKLPLASIKLPLASMEIVLASMKLVLASIKLSLASLKLLLASMELLLASMELVLASIKLPLASMELPLASMEFLLASIELSLASIKLLLASMELLLASMELPLASIKLPLASMEFPLASIKLPLASMEFLLASIKPLSPTPIKPILPEKVVGLLYLIAGTRHKVDGLSLYLHDGLRMGDSDHLCLLRLYKLCFGLAYKNDLCG